MKVYVLFALALLAVSVNAANITLTYSECRDVGNDTYCAPIYNLLNTSAIYQQCIGDFNYNFSNNVREINNSCSSSADRITNIFSQINANFSKLDSINIISDYAHCVIENNLTKAQISLLQPQYERTLTAMQYMVNRSELDVCNSRVASVQNDVKSAEDNQKIYAVIGAIVGAIIVYWYTGKKSANDSNDSRGGRLPRFGRK